MGWFIVIIAFWLAALASNLAFYLWPQVKLRFPSLTRLRLAEIIVTAAILLLLFALLCPADWFQSARY
jgi:hypothetical protein